MNKRKKIPVFLSRCIVHYCRFILGGNIFIFRAFFPSKYSTTDSISYIYIYIYIFLPFSIFSLRGSSCLLPLRVWQRSITVCRQQLWSPKKRKKNWWKFFSLFFFVSLHKNIFDNKRLFSKPTKSLLGSFERKLHPRANYSAINCLNYLLKR